MVVTVRGRGEQVFRSVCDTPCELYVPIDRPVHLYTRDRDTSAYVERWAGSVPAEGGWLQLWRPRDLAREPTSADESIAATQNRLRSDLELVDQHDAAFQARTARREREQRGARHQGSWLLALGIPNMAGGYVTALAGFVGGSGCIDCSPAARRLDFDVAAVGVVAGVAGIIATLAGAIRHSGGTSYRFDTSGIPDAPSVPAWVPITSRGVITNQPTN
jgi:hypothetical protein